MAVLGVGGRVTFKRTPASAATIQPDALRADSDEIAAFAPGLFNGDRVRLFAERGLPFAIVPGTISDPDGMLPDCPDGYGFYGGGPWLLSPVRAHSSSDAAGFYAQSQALPMYVGPSQTGFLQQLEVYAGRDQFDGISFYQTRSDALNAKSEDRLAIFPVDFGVLTLEVIAHEEDWRIQGNLGQWTLNLNAAEVDTTSVGEKWGDAVKSIVTGGGTLDYLIDRFYRDDQEDPTILMNLLLMVEHGCEVEAQFWLIKNREELEDCQSIDYRQLAGSLFYETTLLVTGNAMNTRPEDILAGSASFVTVGQNRLKMGGAGAS
jgi:hypothetical protein